MQRARLLQSAWRSVAQQLPGRRASSVSLGLRYAMPPAGGLPPLHPRRFLATSGILAAADKRNRRSSASERPELNLEDVWTQLESYYQQHGLLNYEHCQRLLEQLQRTQGSGSAAVTLEQLHFLLGSCVPELLPAQGAQERLQLFEGLWRQLLKGSVPTLPHYHTRLQVLRQNRLPLADHRSLLAEIAVYHGSSADVEAPLYSDLLDVAGSSGNMRMATELLAEMRQRSFPLTERNFHALLLGHARNGDLPGAESVLASMRAAGIQDKGGATQALWFEALVASGQLQQAKELLAEEQGFTAPQLLQMLRGVLLTGRNTEETTELAQLVVKELPREFLSGLDLPPAIRSLCIQLVHQGRSQVVIQLVAALPAPQFNLQNQSNNQNVDEYGALLLQEFFRAHVPLEETLQFARQLVQRQQNGRALHLVTELALRRLPSAALQCLEALAASEELRPHYFWPLILHQQRREGESGMLRVLAEMQRLRVECDEETVRQYLLPHLQQTLQQPLEAVKALEAAGVKPSLTLGPTVSHLLQQQHQMAEVLELLKRYPTRLELGTLLQPLTSLAVNARATKRYELFAKVIQALQQKALQRTEDFVGSLLLQMMGPQTRLRQDAASLSRFLHELRRLELQISPAAAEALLSLARQATEDLDLVQDIAKTLQKMRHNQLTLPADAAGGGGFIKHPRDMSLDELECHLVELEAKQLNPRGVLRRLLQLSVRSGRLERAQQLLSKCQALKVQTSAGMMASILDLHIKLRDLPKAQQSLEQLSSSYPAFQIDEHKVIDFAALLVHGQQLEAAKQLLQRRAEQHKVVGGDYVIKNVWQLLTNVAQLAAQATEKPSTNLTREMLEFLRNLGYCQSHNALLGPVVREWLLKGDLEAAVAEFQRLASQHKHTPLQFELLSLLVRLGNGDERELARFPGTTAEAAQQQLAAVTATVSRIHGAANMNSALLLALAESGKETQLRRLIINPEFRINHELLVKNCEHLGQEGAVRTLLRLARGVRGVQRTIDEQKIYDLLLAQFCRSNDYEAALDLFERLEADDELKVSQEFLRNLVQLLQLNRVEIPSGIALRAQIR
ncbi:leucine-rich PPR motif-containing protein, mitochondrial [Drosophila takahashii]|uniref:leucine-rich PPR motif-containing protein, mitochondrial n=1 Tax=Drosophila takahashii TaxID=29030 RepID=UPI001CF7FFB2|nr:leucine-rich PPR motif-containing protein, mitochondrial [Drosophila takahashii]